MMLDVPVLHAVQPQHLREALVLGLLGRVQAGRVVGRRLGLAQPARHRPHVVVDHLDLGGRQSLRIVGADRRQDHVVEILPGRPHAEEWLAGDHRGPDVERRTDRRRDPLAVDVDQGRPRLQDQVGIDGRDAHALGRPVEPGDVLVGTEQPDLAVPAAEPLQALEERLAVVQDGGRRIERERSVGLDPGVVPALLLLEVRDEHVIGEHVAEGQVLVLRPVLPLCRARDPDRLSHHEQAPS
jgi:hypothetical protein